MPELAKNQIYRVAVTGCTAEGQGVARVEGRAVFVRGALPGEEAEIRILKVTKTAVWAKLERLLLPSPERVEPDCPVYARCGGCDFRHVSYAGELEIKKQRVEDAVRRIGGFDLACEDILPSPQAARYRNKAIFNVGTGADGRAATGFYRPRTHELVPVEGCLLQSESADAAAAALRGWMDRFSVPAYDEGSRSGLIRRLFVRDAGGGALVCVVAAAERLPREAALVEALRGAVPGLRSVWLNANASPGNTVLSGPFRLLWGEERVEAVLCDLRFRLSPLSFFQVNLPQAESLYARAVEYAGLTGKEHLLDLYCGTGTIGLVAARKCARVTGAEIVEAAVADARENARRNGIENAEFICADAAEAARRFAESGLRPDVIVLDPPRKGLDPAVIAAVRQMAPERVVYVSCDPATLARDLKRFAEADGDMAVYRPVRLSAADMFPRTRHCEAVCKLLRSDIDP